MGLDSSPPGPRSSASRCGGAWTQSCLRGRWPIAGGLLPGGRPLSRRAQLKTL